MATISKRTIGFLSGYATTGTCKHVVATMADPAVNPVTVTINGVNYVSGSEITMVQVGTDGGGSVPAQVGWVGSFTSSGLSAGTRYSVTLAQGSNTEADCSFITDIDTDTPFHIMFASCDNLREITVSKSSRGMFEVERALYENSPYPILARVHADDVSGYVDSFPLITDGAHSMSLAGGTPASTLKEYSYFLAYFCFLGMIDDEEGWFPQDYNLDEDRLWALRNINLIPFWGDHEFSGTDLGWNTATDDGVTPNAFHATFSPGGQYDGAGLAAWNAVMAPLQPPLLRDDATLQSGAGARDTNAAHCLFSIGNNNFTFFNLDGITNGSGGDPPTTLFGNNQIDDLLEKMAGVTSPFVAEAAVYGVDEDMGDQHGVKTHLAAEWARLYTASTGLFGIHPTGNMGACFMRLNGDKHCPFVADHYDDSGATTEWMYNWHGGGYTGAAVHSLPSDGSATADIIYDTPSDYFSQKITQDAVHGEVAQQYSGIRIDCYPNRIPKEAHLTIVLYTGDAFTRKYIQNKGNTPYISGYILPGATLRLDKN